MIIGYLRDNGYYKYVGNPQCNRMILELEDALSLVAQSIYHDYPTRDDRVLHIGDGCPSSGSCPYHPGVSHGQLKSCDVSYYVLVGENSTGEQKGTEMWNGDTLIEGIFDSERNYMFCYRLTQIIPGTTIRVNEILADEMLKHGDLPSGTLITSEGDTYNHHEHAHLDLREVNKKFRVSYFKGV